MDDDAVDTTNYKVVVNHEQQYSIWPTYQENPLGWSNGGKSGSRAECLAYIEDVWTDIRPLSVREAMASSETPEQGSPDPAPGESVAQEPREDHLVGFLATGVHPVELCLRSESPAKFLKDAIDRGYAHVMFKDTRGGTQVGFPVDSAASDWSEANFDAGTGAVHLEGELTLNGVNVRCVVDLKLESFEGQGALKRVAD